MAKGKSTDRRPARSRYKTSSREQKNKDNNIFREAVKQDFYKLRNRVMMKLKVGKSEAKRIAKTVGAGKAEDSLVAKLELDKQ